MYYFTNQLSRVQYSFQKSRRPRYITRTAIVTLDPNKLVEKKQQCLHIGGQPYFKTRIMLQSSPVLSTALHYQRDRQVVLSYGNFYPPDTKAFLYYSMSPEKPRIAGELRLRVTSSDDPASFESGSDLLKSDGLPWSRPLYILSKFFLPLYEKLREERFVPDDLDRVLLTFPTARLSRSQILYTLNDTFIVDFSTLESYVFVITEQGVQSLSFTYMFYDNRGKYKCTPYTGAYTNHHLLILLYYSHEFVGSALARFERSTLPDHNGTRTLVLRFLKIIIPVKCVVPNYDGHLPCPKEGGLYRRNSFGDRKKRNVWSIDIDKPKFPSKIKPGLQLLWDT
jgi:hypothetical protein